MSTITATSQTASIRDARTRAILSDYAIHTTGTSNSSNNGATLAAALSANGGSASEPELDDGAIDPTTAPHPRVAGVTSPSWWPRNWRNMPEFAPINRHLDRDARPSGANVAEKTMIMIVLNGCALLSTYAYIWRNTVGRLHDRIDKILSYEIGGEY